MTEFIILDAGGVLVAPRMGDWLTPVRFEEIIGETRLAAVSKKQLKRAMEESARVYLDKSLLLPDETWEFAARRNYFVDLARRLGWTLTDREADVLARDMTENDARYDLYADTRSGLNRLREKYPLGLLSDAMPSLQRVMDNAGLWELFDQTVLSCQIGATKPDPAAYRAIAEKLEADPAQCLFGDDRVSNLEGAQKAGMRPVHMDREDRRSWPGERVRDLLELARLVNA